MIFRSVVAVSCLSFSASLALPRRWHCWAVNSVQIHRRSTCFLPPSYWRRASLMKRYPFADSYSFWWNAIALLIRTHQTLVLEHECADYEHLLDLEIECTDCARTHAHTNKHTHTYTYTHMVWIMIDEWIDWVPSPSSKYTRTLSFSLSLSLSLSLSFSLSLSLFLSHSLSPSLSHTLMPTSIQRKMC